MDCNPKSKWCDGDNINDHLSYLYSGTVLESVDPYTGAPGKCPATQNLFGLHQGPVQKFKMQNYEFFNGQSDQSYTTLAEKKPFLTYLEITNPMRFYKSGIYTPTDKECDEKKVGGFYLNLDGYSMDMDYNGYYILKFPWSWTFGESGNMKFIKNKNNDSNTKGLCSFYKYGITIEAQNP